MKFRYIILSALVSCLFVAACAKNRPKDAKSASKTAGSIEQVDKAKVDAANLDQNKSKIALEKVKDVSLAAADSCESTLNMKIDDATEEKIDIKDYLATNKVSWQLQKIDGFKEVKEMDSQAILQQISGTADFTKGISLELNKQVEGVASVVCHTSKVGDKTKQPILFDLHGDYNLGVDPKNALGISLVWSAFEEKTRSAVMLIPKVAPAAKATDAKDNVGRQLLASLSKDHATLIVRVQTTEVKKINDKQINITETKKYVLAALVDQSQKPNDKAVAPDVNSAQKPPQQEAPQQINPNEQAPSAPAPVAPNASTDAKK